MSQVPTREADVEARIGVPPGVLRPFYRDIVSAGYLSQADDGVLELTGRGQAEADKLVAAWKAWLVGELRDWEAEAEAGSAPAVAAASASATAGAAADAGRSADGEA